MANESCAGLVCQANRRAFVVLKFEGFRSLVLISLLSEITSLQVAY